MFSSKARYLVSIILLVANGIHLMANGIKIMANEIHLMANGIQIMANERTLTIQLQVTISQQFLFLSLLVIGIQQII